MFPFPLTKFFFFAYFQINSYLLTDPKQRKIIICESPLAPVRVKQVVAKVLFQNFQVFKSLNYPFAMPLFIRLLIITLNSKVPSISWAPLHLLALLTTGLTTGLVVDCGNLETTVLPV